mmetsp:Transcript_8787/g.38763  ORF Transcript_8787/g.38763 Transcript_8787/m.38763 type:complete len:283 (+) Transcript_8787:357-1205(+)
MPHSARESSTTRPASAPSHPMTTPSQSSYASSSLHRDCSLGIAPRSSARSSKSRCGSRTFARGPRRRTAVCGDRGLAGSPFGGVSGSRGPSRGYFRLSGLVASINLARSLRVSASSKSALRNLASARSARASAVFAAASASSVAIASLLITSVAASSSSLTCALTSAETTLERSDSFAAAAMSNSEMASRRRRESASAAWSLASVARSLERRVAFLAIHASITTMTPAIARTTVPGARGTTSSPPPTRRAAAGRFTPSRAFATCAKLGTPTRVVVTASLYRL